MAGAALGKEGGPGSELLPIRCRAERVCMAGVTLEAEEGFVLSLQILGRGPVGLMAKEAPLRCRGMLESEGALLFSVAAEAKIVHRRLSELPGPFGAVYLVAVGASHFPLLDGVMGRIGGLGALLLVAVVAKLRLEFRQEPLSLPDQVFPKRGHEIQVGFPHGPLSLLPRGMDPVTAHAAHFSPGMRASRPAQQEPRGGMTAQADLGSLGGGQILEADDVLGVLGVENVGFPLAVAPHTPPLAGDLEVGQSAVDRRGEALHDLLVPMAALASLSPHGGSLPGHG